MRRGTPRPRSTPGPAIRAAWPTCAGSSAATWPACTPRSDPLFRAEPGDGAGHVQPGELAQRDERLAGGHERHADVAIRVGVHRDAGEAHMTEGARRVVAVEAHPLAAQHEAHAV